MLKIALHCHVNSSNEVESALSKYFEQKNIGFELFHVGSSSKFLSNYFFNKDFRLLLIYKNDHLSYIMKIYNNFSKKYTHMVSGVLDFPLDNDEIEKKLFKHIENTYCCPFGVYNVSNRTILRRILHEDIEYICRIKNRSVIHLKNGETEEVTTSINKIQKELSEKYFVKCSRGYLVNIFNVEKAYKDSNLIELKSGRKIPLSKVSFRKFLKAYIESMSGYTIHDN